MHKVKISDVLLSISCAKAAFTNICFYNSIIIVFLNMCKVIL